MPEASFAIEKLIRPDLARLRPYEAPQAWEKMAQPAGMTTEQIIKLDTNENPYGCSPRVAEALGNYRHYNLYPDPTCGEVRQWLERYTGVSRERIVVGNGSDELIQLTLNLFLEPGDEVIICPPTFTIYAVATAIAHGETVAVSRDANFAVDVEAVLAAVGRKTKVIVIASPNSPTGNIIGIGELRRLLGAGVVVLLDEAYAEFSGQTALPLAAQYDNLIVLRSFSKWAGIAGLRAGYGIYPAAVVPHLLKIKLPYNVSVAAQQGIVATLADLEGVLATVRRIIEERGRLLAELRKLDFAHPFPSQANFILLRLSRGDAHDVNRRLQQVGILLRDYNDAELQDCLRISVGRPEQNDRLLAELRRIGREL